MRLFFLASVLAFPACVLPTCDDDEELEDGICKELEDEDGEGAGGPYGSLTDVVAACHAYFDAYEACLLAYGDANGVDMSGSMLSDSWCEDTYGGLQDVEATLYLSCLADVYAEAECMTAEGWGAAGTRAGECVAG